MPTLSFTTDFDTDETISFETDEIGWLSRIAGFMSRTMKIQAT
jgi:hypothetical protein